MSIIWVKETDQPSHNMENTWHGQQTTCHPHLSQCDAHLLEESQQIMYNCIFHSLYESVFKNKSRYFFNLTDVTWHVSQDTPLSQGSVSAWCSLATEKAEANPRAIQREIQPGDNRR